MRRGFLFIIAFMAAPAFAATFIVPTDRDMIRRSDAIVVGEALSSYTQRGEHVAIETVTPFSVSEVIKGDISSKTINIHEPGGILGNTGLMIPGTPRFMPGERVLVFLRKIGSQAWASTDLTLGRFTLTSDAIGQKLAVRAEDDIFGWDPDLTLHREPRRDAEKFLQFLRTEVHGGIGQTDYIVRAYPVRPISAQAHPMPNSSASGHTGMSYTYSLDRTNTGTGGRWFDFPSLHTFYMATMNTALTGESAGSSTTEPGAPGSGLNAVNSAMAAWTNESRSNVNYMLSGSAAPCSPNCTGLHASDGTNTLTFEADLTTFGASLVPFQCTNMMFNGLLGLGGAYVNISPTVGPDGDAFYPVTEGDVEMNRGIANCAFPGFFTDVFVSAVTHEVGHTLGFRHSDQTRADNSGVACSTDATLECDSTNALMKSFVPNGKAGVLQTYDINAVESLYPCAFGGGCNVHGDFTGDNNSDVLWRNSSTGANTVWQMSGLTVVTGIPLAAPDPSWKVAGVGDFDGNGTQDILWRNSTTGDVGIWLMNGTSLTSATTVATVPAVWQIVGVGDVNSDGKADVFWWNSATGDVNIWLMNGAVPSGSMVGTVPDVNWHIAGVGDFNGDGKADVFWRNISTGQNGIWFMNGTSISSATATNTVADLNYQIAGIADVNGDGRADVIWRRSGTGEVVFWLMSGASPSGGLVGTVADSNWHIEAIGDFNGDGRNDLFWRNVTTGQVAMWMMNGLTISSSGYVSTVGDLNWGVVAPR